MELSSPAGPNACEFAMDMSLTFNVPIGGVGLGNAATPSSVMDCGTTHLVRQHGVEYIA